MSCGRRVELNGYYSRDEIAQRLSDAGDWREARAIERKECLSYMELRRVEQALDREGLRENWDYSTRECYCDED